MDLEFVIRPAVIEDIPSINAILTHYALNTVITFTTEAHSDEALESKFRHVTEENGFPFLVAALLPSPQTKASNNVIGISYISPWRPERLAYRHTGEISLFVHPDHQGKGIGSGLLEALIGDTAHTQLKELLALMSVDTEGRGAGLTLRDFYLRRGFREVGTMEKVGYKFNRW